MTNLSISLFRGYSDKEPKGVSLGEVVRLIRTDESVRNHTEKYRFLKSHGDDTGAAREKSGSPCFAVAVRFEGGKQKSHICGNTGLCLCDFDHLPPERLPELRARAIGDPHTLLAYTTISGEGLRIIFHATLPKEGERGERGEGSERDEKALARRHEQLFARGNRHYERLLGCRADGKCRNLTRLSGVAHDPEVFFNPAAKPFAVTPTAAMADVIHQEVRRQGAVYAPGSHNDYIMRAGYLMNKYGIPEAEAAEWAAEEFADYAGDVPAIIRSCYGRTDEHGTLTPPDGTRNRRRSYATDEGMHASVQEIEEFLEGKARFRFNVVSRQVEVADAAEGEFRELTDRTVNTFWRQMCKERKRVRISDLYNVIQSEFTPEFNPFADYLGSLPPWDGTTDHISRLAATVHCADTDETRQPFAESLRKWLVAMVASMCDAETVNNQILVLVGPQGVYKTTWFKKLLPPPLARYFYTKTNSSRFTKDDLFTLSEFALICFEEIDYMTLPELNRFKAMVTLPGIHERAAYGRNKEHRPHLASFCATGNNERFLVDRSGNRRWLPYLVTHIDDPYRHPVDYTGVYSQAYALYRNGFQYWFDREETDGLNRHNADFEMPNLEEELILTYYRRPIPGEECRFVTTANLLERIGSAVRSPLSTVNIGRAMVRLGFKQVHTRHARGFLVKERSAEEIRLAQQSIGREHNA